MSICDIWTNAVEIDVLAGAVNYYACNYSWFEYIYIYFWRCKGECRLDLTLVII